ncbi:MAG: glycosyltransferase family 9 protein [bacterium]|nr:glycosyltransferase family 9 protein [bacterium]
MYDIHKIENRKRRYVRFFKAKRAVEAVYNRASTLFKERMVSAADIDSVERVLAVHRILRIGDTLVARPAMAALRGKYPDAHIAVLCAADIAELLEPDLGVYYDEVIPVVPDADRTQLVARVASYRFDRAYVMVTDRFSLRLPYLAGIPYSVGYDYAGRGALLTAPYELSTRANSPGYLYAEDEPPVHISQIWLDLIQPDTPAPVKYPGFTVTEDAEEEAAVFAERSGLTSGEYVVLHPFPAHLSYRWQNGRWRESIQELGKGQRIVITGGPGDAGEAKHLAEGTGAVVAAGELGILGSMALIRYAAAVVSVDTAAVHIASTVGTPVIGLYGPGDPVLWGPLGVPHKVLFHEEPCSLCKKAKCFQDRRHCIEEIGVGEALEAVADY